MVYDVHIIGGGPAGLSAALWLGRACRTVLLSDAGVGRNHAARVMHGLPTRDGITPAMFRRSARRELTKYGVETRFAAIDEAWIVRGRRAGAAQFGSRSSDGHRYFSRKLLLATGVRDQLPVLSGFAEFYGRSAFHCPYCDGWERRGQRLVAYGAGKDGAGLGLMLRTWSRRTWVCTGGTRLSPTHQERLLRNGIRWRIERIVRLEGHAGNLARIVFESGRPLACDSLFFNTGQFDRGNLAWQLGCKFTKDGEVRCDKRGSTGVPGLFLAGDASHEVQFVVTAAADGARAAVAINRELQDESTK